MAGLRYDPNKPAANHRAMQERFEAVTLCGKNRGPHDYIPTFWREWDEVKDGKPTGHRMRSVAEFMCRVCFTRVEIDTLLKNFSRAEL